jgi:hypothetical protein
LIQQLNVCLLIARLAYGGQQQIIEYQAAQQQSANHECGVEIVTRPVSYPLDKGSKIMIEKEVKYPLFFVRPLCP